MRYRLLSFSGNYATGGEVISLSGPNKTQNLGLTRVLGVILLDSLIRAPGATTGVEPVIDVSADGKTVTIRALEDAAGVAGAPIGVEKTNAEAYIASSQLPVIFVGE